MPGTCIQLLKSYKCTQAQFIVLSTTLINVVCQRDVQPAICLVNDSRHQQITVTAKHPVSGKSSQQTSVIFVLIYFSVLVLVLVLQLFFSFRFVLVFSFFRFRFRFSFANYFLVLVLF